MILPLGDVFYVSTPFLPEHQALDFACPCGTPLLACMGGRLTHEYKEGGGLVARITADTLVSRYCHLSAYVVGDGVQVQAGDLIALSGNSGTLTTGPHLHWETKINGVAVNPAEYVTMKKTNNHYENAPNEAQLKREAASNHSVIKSVWPFPAVPGKTCISRHWIGGDGEEQKYIDRGVAGAQDLFKRMLPLYHQYPGLHWEVLNEPDTSTLAKCKMLCVFLVEYARLMHANGFKLDGPVTGEGRPEDNTDSTSAQKTAALGPAYMVMDIITCHGYYCPPQVLPDNAWHTVRYRKIKADLAAAGFFPTAKWVLSENGIDRLVIGAPGGFQNVPMTQQAYLPYIEQFDMEICKDDYVLGCTIYTLNPNPQWVSYNYGGWLEDKLYELAEPNSNGLLAWAETIVIPFNPDAALGQYIDLHSWSPQSQEMSFEGVPYQWGRFKVDGVYYRTLLSWQYGRVVEITTVKN